MIQLVLNYSLAKGKRYVVRMFKNNEYIRLINFGSSEHENYTMHRDDKRKELYINRHRKEDWGKISAGSLSRYLLWNKKTLNESIKDYENKFQVKIINRL